MKIMPNYVDIYTPEYTTCCGWHVRKMAFFIGYLSLVLAIIGLRCVWVLLKYVTYTPAYIVMFFCFLTFIVMIFCHSFLIFASIKEKPGYYIPYLVFDVSH
uniref:Uncharacterized protein n=1 Tax=Panagrolaimus sp. JU765 TaxID=591449 RepID=A0AC34Q8B9_9BILA